VREAFPDDADLAAFFGTEPALMDPGIPWEYNTLTFTVRRASDSVTCVIVPALIVVELTWTREREEIIRVTVAEIERVHIASENGGAVLAAATAGNALALRLRLDPAIHLSIGNGFRR
jgi:hypothetical protein